MGQLKNSDSVASVTLTSAGAAATAGVVGSPYAITPSAATGSGLANYIISYHDASVGLTVNAIALDITADNQSKNYADTFTFTGTEFTTGMGQLKNTDSVASVTLTSAGAAATATVAGSPYTITPSAAMGTGLANYIISYHDASVGLTVSAIALDITADNQSKNYADTFTFTGTEFTTGIGQLKNTDSVASVTLTSAGAEMTATVAGSPYAITPSAAIGSGLSNYNISYHDASVGLTVNAIALDITANNQSKNYGDTFTFTGSEFTVGAGQLKNSDSVVSVTLTSAGAAMTATVAGSPYSITPSAATGSGLGNYNISYHDASIGLTVNAIALDITATNESKTYGDTFTPNGTTQFSTAPGQLKNGDIVASVTLTSSGYAASATVTAPGPNYTINIGSAVFAPVGAGGNYNITYHTGTLHIDAAQLDITASNQNKTYGDTFTFTGTEFATGMGQLKNGDTVTSAALTSVGEAATATVTAPGPTILSISARRCSLQRVQTVTTASPITLEHFMWIRRMLRSPLTSTSKTYGQLVTFAGTEFTTSGFINGDNVASVTLMSAGAAMAATFTAPGPDYAIVPSAAMGTGLGNYIIAYVGGNLHVNQAALTITATNVTKTYGVLYAPDTTTPSTEFSVSGLVNSDTVASIMLASTGYPASATYTSPGPDYTITPSAAPEVDWAITTSAMSMGTCTSTRRL